MDNHPETPGSAARSVSNVLEKGEGFLEKSISHLSAHTNALGREVSGVAQDLRDAAAHRYERLDRAKLKSFWQERAHLDLPAWKNAGFGLPDFGQKYQEAKLDALGKLTDLGAPVRAKVMFGLLCAMKSLATKDPDMWDCVKYGVDEVLDTFWSDLTVYAEELYRNETLVLANVAADGWEELGALGNTATPCSPRWWRAFFLYHIQPFDRSIFGRLKDPVFLVCLVLSLVPSHGIRIMVKTFVLSLLLTGGTPDEYQLTDFIVGLKGSQFLSSGLIQAAMASVQYYMCIRPGGTHTCDSDGPGANQCLVTGLVDWLGSCVIAWVAFFCLPCSTESAGIRYPVDDDEQDEELGQSRRPPPPRRVCCCTDPRKTLHPGRGGRLQGLLLWDVVSFILSFLFMITLMFTDILHWRPGGDPAVIESPLETLELAARTKDYSALFWARVLYAFLSFPFTLFLIPGLSSVLTHTTPTGFNRNGVCVPSVQRPKLEKST